MGCGWFASWAGSWERGRGRSSGSLIRSAVASESLRTWVKQADIDEGLEPGVSTAEQTGIGELEQEVRELRRANDLLKRASAFFMAELDRPSR